MTKDDVCEFVAMAESLGVNVWLDGGWAVDANLGSQTRLHSDLDIVIEQRHVDRLVTALADRGYEPVPRDDTRAWNFVMGDRHGREIDFHVVVVDERGCGIYGPPENDDFYSAQALAGRVELCSRLVACTSPEWLIESHTGYLLEEKDWADVLALCSRFGIPIPDEHRGHRG